VVLIYINLNLFNLLFCIATRMHNKKYARGTYVSWSNQRCNWK